MEAVFRIRFWVLWLGLLFSAHPSAGELLIFFDLDADPASGCAVATAEGSFAGVEQILTTRYAASTVTEVVRSECVDPPTEGFGPEQSVSLGGWPVGLTLGSGGSDLVETFVGLADLGNFAPSVRSGFATRDVAGVPADAMLGQAGAGFELVMFTVEPAGIPTLQRLGLLFLALLLVGLSLYGLRRHPGAYSLVLMVSLSGSLVGLVWAAMTPNGDPSDWNPISPLGTDATGDGGGDDLVAGFAMVDGDHLRLRGDLFWNQPPAIADQAFSIDENSANDTLVGTLAASDPDVGDTRGFVVTGGSGSSAFAVEPDSGEIRVADSAQLDFETNPSFRLDLQVSDAAGLQDTALVTIDLNDIDEAPVAVSDSATVAEDAAATTIDVLANDTDVDAGPKAVDSVTQPTNGTVVNNGTSLSYQPNPNYCNDGAPTDDFSYTLTPGGSSTTVAMTVSCVDDAPVAVGETATVTEGDPATRIDVLGNDTDIDGGPLTIAGVTQPANGTVINNGTDLSYQPDLDYCNDGAPTDDFTYTLNGGSTATVAVSVTCIDDAPIAVTDSAAVSEDAAATIIDVLANDTDLDGGPIGIASVTQPANGTVVNNGANVSYQPDADYCNDGVPSDDFIYTLTPGGDSATVAVTVTCENDPPLGVDDPFWASSGVFDVIAVVCTDCASPVILPAGRTLEVVLEATSAVAAGYGLGGLAGTDFSGIAVSQSTSAALAVGDRLTVTLSGSADAEPFGARFDICAIAPASAADPCASTLNTAGMGFGASFSPAGPIGPLGFSTDQDSAFTSDSVLSNDTDIDGGALSVTGIDTTATLGLVTDRGDGTFGYDPDGQFDALAPGETAVDQFRYTVDDGNGGSDTAVVSVTIFGVNNAPSFTAGGDETVLEDAGPQTSAAWATVMDDGDGGSQTLSFNITANTNPGLFSAGPAVDAVSGDLTYTPAADANGSATLTLTLSDDGGTADGGVDNSSAVNFTINVTAVNDAPSFVSGGNVNYAGAATAQTEAGWATAISAGPTDETGQVLSFNVIGNTNAGLFSVAPAVDPVSGDLTYTPAASAAGTANITLELADDGSIANGGADTSAAAIFNITISVVNQEPSFTAGPDQTVSEDAGPQTVAGWATNIDDGAGGTQALTFQVTNDNNALFSAQPAVNATTGSLTYSPAANASGSATVSVTLTDDGGTANGGDDTSPTATFTISVTAVDDPPATVNDSATLTEDDPATTIDVIANDNDPDGGSNTISGVTQPVNGTVVITNAGANLTYQPNPNYCNDQAPASPDAFTYTLSPGGDTGLVAVTVACVNDPPVVTPPANYASHAHVGISITDGAADLLDGAAIADVDGPGAAPFSLGTTGTIVTANGGNATINANGSFTYNPPAGFTGNDSFPYQICDSGVPVPSQCAGVTATVVVSGPRVWFVDSAAPGGGAGRLSDPFNALAAADTAANANGDRIFVYTGVGTYSGGFTLLDSQRLVGQGVVDTDFDTALGIAPPADSPARPAINGARPTITGTIALAPNVRARGFNVSNTNLNGVTGSGASGLVIDQVSVTTTSGTAVNLANSGGTVSFTNISANGAVNGIVLNTTTGSFTITGDGTGAQNASGGTIQNTSGDGIVLTDTANIVINQIALDNTARHGIVGIGVNNLTINDSTFNNVGDANDENTFEFRAGIASGAAAITGMLTLDTIDVTNFHDTGLLVYNESGTLTVNVTDSDFSDNDDTDGVDAIFVEGEGTSSLTMTVTGGLCDNVEGDCVRFEAGGTGANDVNVVGLRSTNGGGPDDFPNGGGIELVVDDGATLTFDIQGNDIRDVRGDPLIIASLIGSGGGNLEGRVGGAAPADGNTFSGSSLGDGMQFTLEGGGTAATGRDFTILVQNNDIGVDNTGVGGLFNGLGDDGIQILHRDNSGMLNLTVEDNNIANTGSEAIRSFSDDDTGLGAGNPANEFRIAGNILSSITDPQNIELRTSDTADACYHVSGNTLPAAINLSIAGLSTAEITQASLVVLSAENGSATISGDIPSFNGICTNPVLPANP